MPNCNMCGKTIETWQEWWSGQCLKSTTGLHSVTNTEWMTLPGWDKVFPKHVNKTDVKEET